VIKFIKFLINPQKNIKLLRRDFQMLLLESTLNLLADGKFHSDKEISKFLGISYKMVPEVLKQILDPSINLEVVNGKNYRIFGGLELLDASYIVDELGKANQLLSQLEVLTLIDSTNNYLLNKTEYTGNYAVFAEQQTAGRGQFKRNWHSSFGKNIALSVLWQFSNPLNKLAGLTLVVGIAIVKALEEYGLKRIQLKWPNDIIHEGKKLAGILIESRSIERKVQKMVIGIGLNLYNPSTYSIANDQAITSIFSLKNLPPRRNRLAVLILKNLVRTLIEFETKGLDYFMQDWHRLDGLAGKLITIQNQTNILEGIGRGINTQGQLCVQIKNQTHYFNSGEIRVKLKPDD
jgi:BirA family biotin operon repressor/biotin-[acetyl-CoA-carboxylase] ligase